VKQLALVVTLLASVALAEGALPVSLSAKERAALEPSIAAARASNPDAFSRVAALRTGLARIDASKRGRYAPVTSMLNAVPNATWALVDAIVFSGAVDSGLPASARIAWQAGLLESLGGRRDDKTEAVLTAALRTPGLEPAVRRAAATSGPDREAVFAGMGSCRRLVVTAFLAQQLSVASTESEQLALVKALSINGNAWALQTPQGAPVPAEVPRLQSVAAGALVKAFVSASGRVKTEAHDALRIVNAPDTVGLLAQSRALDPSGVDGLIALLGK
jgi:hypothetical protein